MILMRIQTQYTICVMTNFVLFNFFVTDRILTMILMRTMKSQYFDFLRYRVRDGNRYSSKISDHVLCVLCKHYHSVYGAMKRHESFHQRRVVIDDSSIASPSLLKIRIRAHGHTSVTDAINSNNYFLSAIVLPRTLKFVNVSFSLVSILSICQL